MRRIPIAAALAAAALFVAPLLPARAESRDPRTVTLGWMTERADAVVLARVAEVRALPRERAREVDLLVDEVVRGPLVAGTTVVLLHEAAGSAVPWTPGASHLLFLRVLPVPPGAPSRWEPLSGDFSVRALPAEGPVARFPGIVRAHAAALDGEGAVARPDDLRKSLVAWMEDGDPGIAWSAATDFVRHGELHADLTPEEGARIVDSFRRRAAGKADKGALALAVACTRDPGSAKALVEALDDPRGRLVRDSVGEALRRMKDGKTHGLLATRLESAGPAQRADLLAVLGATGATEGAGPAGKHLADPVPEVRVEAAHALGRIARAAREEDPDARVAGRESLARRVREGSTENERRAGLWALAQLDEAEAWEVLRGFAADDPRDPVRAFARDLLRRPRQSLVLR